MKVALILGVFGLLRMKELHNIEWTDVEISKEDIVIVQNMR
jgi:hypothetical protein